MTARTILDRHGAAVPVFAITEVGARYATRVRVVATPEMPTCFEGRRGRIGTVHHAEAISVRFDNSPLELEFGPSQLEAI